MVRLVLLMAGEEYHSRQYRTGMLDSAEGPDLRKESLLIVRWMVWDDRAGWRNQTG